jgi:hypothetical protein
LPRHCWLIYLHYVFDLWANRWRKRHARGQVIIVRYADDSAPRARGRAVRLAYSRANCATDEGKKAPRDLLAGAGLKSPLAAVVKSHGGEHKKEKAREEPGQMRQEEVERK